MIVAFIIAQRLIHLSTRRSLVTNQFNSIITEQFLTIWRLHFKVHVSFIFSFSVLSHGVKTPQRLKLGQNGVIELGVSAYPPLEYEWRKDGQLMTFPMEGKSIDLYSGSVTITRVERGDQGAYTCRVVWKAGRPRETEDTVEIQVFVVGKCS